MKSLEQKFSSWREKLREIETNYDLSKRKSSQILSRKQESIKKLKYKVEVQNEPELEKLLVSMIKDFDSKSNMIAKEDKDAYEVISRHEQRFYGLIVEWIEPLRTALSDLQEIKTIRSASNRKGTSPNKREIPIVKTTLVPEILEAERPQSPYSVVLSPNKVSKITKRPPIPTPTPRTSMKPDPSIRNNEAAVSRNETRCYNATAPQGEYLRFHDLKESKEFSPQRLYNELNEINKTQSIKTSFLSSKIQNGHKSETSSNEKSTIARSLPAAEHLPLRPKTPPLKSIADQTAKAALIRTLITERINSCSPINM